MEDPARPRGSCGARSCASSPPARSPRTDSSTPRTPQLHPGRWRGPRAARAWPALDLSTGDLPRRPSPRTASVVDEAWRVGAARDPAPEERRWRPTAPGSAGFAARDRRDLLEECAFDLRRGRERLTGHFGTLPSPASAARARPRGSARRAPCCTTCAETQQQRTAPHPRLAAYALERPPGPRRDHARRTSSSCAHPRRRAARDAAGGARPHPHADGRAPAARLAAAPRCRTGRDRGAPGRRGRAPAEPARAGAARAAAGGPRPRAAGRPHRPGPANARDLVGARPLAAALPALWAELAAVAGRAAAELRGGDRRAARPRRADRAPPLRDDAAADPARGRADPRPATTPSSTSCARGRRAARRWIARARGAERERTGIHPQGRLQPGLRLLHRGHQGATSASVPADYVRKQTLVNAERFITPRAQGVREQGPRRRGAQADDLEYELFLRPARGGRRAHAGRIQATARGPGRARRASPRWPSAPPRTATAGPRDRRRGRARIRSRTAATRWSSSCSTRRALRPQRRRTRRREPTSCSSSPAPTWPASPPTCARWR